MTPLLRRSPLLLATATAGALLAPATALATPPPRDATPAVLRAYAASGQYLTDVTAAAAPARAALIARLDAIAAQRAACRAAGIAPPAPASTASLRAVAPGASGPTGSVRLLFKQAALRRSGARVGTGTSRTVRLTPSRLTFASGSATIDLDGTVKLTRRGRTSTLRSLRVVVTASTARVQATVGGRRVTVLRSVSLPGNVVLSAATGRVRAAAARASLTSAGVRAVRSTRLRAGPVAVVSVDVRRAAGGPLGSPATPVAPATPTITAPTTPAAPTTTTPTVTTPTPPTPAPTFIPTAASCGLVPARPAIVLDIDETAMSNYLGRAGAPITSGGGGGDPGGGSSGMASASVLGRDIALAPVKAIYDEATDRGAATFFVTARSPVFPPGLQQTTLTNLTEQGYGSDPQVVFKANPGDDSGIYKRDARRTIETEGFTIVQNVGDQCTDLYGGAAEMTVKIPNPFYLSGGTGAPADSQTNSETCPPG